MAVTFKYDGKDMEARLQEMGAKLLTGMLMYSATKAPIIRARMQTERPWIDRTAMAKTRLNAQVSTVGGTIIRTTLSHGVWYGFYLEMSHGKKYAIIKPTIDKQSPIIVSDMQNLFSKINI